MIAHYNTRILLQSVAGTRVVFKRHLPAGGTETPNSLRTDTKTDRQTDPRQAEWYFLNPSSRPTAGYRLRPRRVTEQLKHFRPKENERGRLSAGGRWTGWIAALHRAGRAGGKTERHSLLGLLTARYCFSDALVFCRVQAGTLLCRLWCPAFLILSGGKHEEQRGRAFLKQQHHQAFLTESANTYLLTAIPKTLNMENKKNLKLIEI